MFFVQRLGFTAFLVCCTIAFASSEIEPGSTSSDATIAETDSELLSSGVTDNETDINNISIHYSETVINSTSKIDISETISAYSSTADNAKALEFNVTASGFSEDIEETTSDFESEDYEEGQCPKDDSKPCLVKCCPMGESIGLRKSCEPSSLKVQVHFFGKQNVSNISGNEDAYNYVIGDPCPYGRYRLEPLYDSNDEFHILENGSIRAPYLFLYPLQPHEYCLDVFKDSDTEEENVLPLICFKEPPPHEQLKLQYILYPIGLLISVPFLIVTMLVYCLIPELRDLHGKALTCHVSCLAVAYIFLAAVQLVGDTFDQELCVGVAFVIHFSFVACFFWLNVLCFDTWWNVTAHVKLCGNAKQHPDSQYMCYKLVNEDVSIPKSTERKIFIFYSLYAWCSSIIFVIISMVIDLMPTIPSSYLKPNFGDSKCWFNTEEAELQYFYGPVGFLIFVNIMLFISSACNVYKFKLHCEESKRTPRQTFRLCLTLFGVMGINWVMEVISWAVGGPDYIWYFTDVINTLQGVIIFCIFVLEPRIRDRVRLQLWPKLSEILCHRRTSHANVVYNTPAKASRTINDV